MDLNDDETKLIKNFRNLNISKKRAVVASKQSFKNWLQTSLSAIWHKISSVFNDVWTWFRGAVTHI